MSWQVSKISSYLSANQGLGIVYCSMSFFISLTSMLLSLSRHLSCLRTQVMFPTLASIAFFCSFSFSTSLSPRSRFPSAVREHLHQLVHPHHGVALLVAAAVVTVHLVV